MVRIKVSANTCKNGDQIDVDIFSRYGALIATKNTIINESIRKILMNMNIDDFWVLRASQENQSDSIDPQLDNFYRNFKSTVDILEKLIENLSNNDTDLSNLELISNSIFNEITHCQYIVKFLYEIKNHDDYTFKHSLCVAFYSALICKWMNLNEGKAKNIIKTGLLHDIGKTKIPIDLLNKKENLLPEEFSLIKEHSMYGYNLIKNIVTLDSDIKLGVLLHHEREDGSGYPMNFNGKQLNLNVKIVSIADTYDALISDRVYRSKFTPFEAFNILMREGITAYDINIMNIFLHNLSQYYIGSQVLLDSGETGKVIYIPTHNITKPVISANSKFIDLSKDNSLNIVSIVDKL